MRLTSPVVIKLEDINRSEHGELYVGGRKRLASCTGVRFLNRNRLLATSLVGKRMYLISYDFTAGTHHVESWVPTLYAGQEVTTDLLDFDGYDSIVTSNCDLDSVSLYRLVGNQISHAKDLPIKDSEAEFCHGAKFVPGDDAICATCVKGERNVYFVSTLTGDVLYKFGHGDWIPRDACFVTGDRMVVVYSRGYPGATPNAELVRESKACLVGLDLPGAAAPLPRRSLVAGLPGRMLRPRSRARSTSATSCATSSRCARSTGTRSRSRARLPGYDFPHGVDVLPEFGLLAVTNYGSNSIMLTRL